MDAKFLSMVESHYKVMGNKNKIFNQFSKIVKNHGKKSALYYPETEQSTSYSELLELTSIISILIKNALTDDECNVLIISDKSPENYATILSCISLGIAYANLDPNIPEKRFSRILNLCSPIILIDLSGYVKTGTALENSCQFKIIRKDDIQSKVKEYNEFKVHNNSPMKVPEIKDIEDPDEKCLYIMFTSGSTGDPKGVVITHDNLMHFVKWAIAEHNICSSSRITQVNPPYFDNFVFDFYTSLLSGATLVPLSQECIRNPYTLVQMVEKAKCNYWFSVPSLLIYLINIKALSTGCWPNMTNIIFGGEGYPLKKLKALYDIFNSQAKIINVYGPTECTCICTSYIVSEKDFQGPRKFPPLGKVNKNFSLKLDKQVNDSTRTRAELVLGGVQVGKGYLHSKDQTERSFFNLTADNQDDIRYYRTGDLVDIDENGNLYFCGREDLQIKRMGYRIELEEIESTCSQIEYINESIAFTKSDKFDQTLLYLIVSSSKHISSSSARQDLKQILPSYMIPNKIKVIFEKLPKNANGKIDRNASQRLALRLLNENF